MAIEKFKSHQQLRNRCIHLVKENKKVCQAIIDYATFDIEYLANFNLEKDFIYQEEDETDENYGMYKIYRGYSYNYSDTIH